jgi:hypothetical protein
MRTTLRNGMICGLAASMAGILTACSILKATIETISGVFSPTGLHSNSTLNQDNRTHLARPTVS